MTLEEIVLRIRQLRDRKNLSARALSLKLEKNDSYIKKLESLEIKPSMEIILQILEVCNTSCEEFFYSNMSEYEKDKELLSYIKSLTPTQKEKLLNLFE